MHELSLAQGILETILRRAQQDGFRKVNSVHLKVGRLAGVEIESLRFCFEVLSASTIARMANLEVEVVPLRGKCRDCGEGFELAEIELICPRCGSGEVEIVSGREFIMETMEVE
jgi:hydrogenase nickel incorporation protein HypA/HybF